MVAPDSLRSPSRPGRRPQQTRLESSPSPALALQQPASTLKGTRRVGAQPAPSRVRDIALRFRPHNGRRCGCCGPPRRLREALAPIVLRWMLLPVGSTDRAYSGPLGVHGPGPKEHIPAGRISRCAAPDRSLSARTSVSRFTRLHIAATTEPSRHEGSARLAHLD